MTRPRCAIDGCRGSPEWFLTGPDGFVGHVCDDCAEILVERSGWSVSDHRSLPGKQAQL